MHTEARLVEAPADFPTKVADFLERLAGNIRNRKPKAGLGGEMLDFIRSGSNLGRPTYRIVSKRGGFTMGRIEWSNAWRKPCVRIDPESVLNQQCIMEIYAMMKNVK